ncbi:MAG: hypothetical protein ACXWWE_01635 [Nitrospira sp.]
MAMLVMRRLRTVRDLVFLVGPDLMPDVRRLMVRFAVPPDERTGLLKRLQTLSDELPIAAQLGLDVVEANNASQTQPGQPDMTVPTIRL